MGTGLNLETNNLKTIGRRKLKYCSISIFDLQREPEDQIVAFTTTFILLFGFKLTPCSSFHAASLNKRRFTMIIYLCLMASNKQQIQWTRIRRNLHEHWITGNSLADEDFSKLDVLSQ